MDTPTLTEVKDILYTSSAIQGWNIISRSTKELYIRDAIDTVVWCANWGDTYRALVKHIENRIAFHTNRQVANGC